MKILDVLQFVRQVILCAMILSADMYLVLFKIRDFINEGSCQIKIQEMLLFSLVTIIMILCVSRAKYLLYKINIFEESHDGK